MQQVFVYGSLLFPEITKKLTGKSFKTLPAIVEGYKMYCVKGCDYPAIVRENGTFTNGKVLLDVEESDILKMSFFEGDEYEKKKISVLVNGKPEDAFVFVWVKGNDLLDDEEWDFQEFEKNSLEYYINEVIPETLDEFHRNR